MRIVSLIPSGTEIIGLLGAESMLVAVSEHCTDIPIAHGLPVCTTPAKEAKDPLACKNGFGGGYQVDKQALSGFEADLVITDTHHALGDWVVDGSPRPVVLELDPKSVEDMLDDVYRVGEAIGCRDQAMHAVVGLRQRMDRAEEHINPYDDGPVCGFLQWLDPLFVAGLWNVQLIGRAGARHPLNELVATPGSGAAVGPQQAQRLAGASIAVSCEVFLASNPEHLVVAPCSKSLDETMVLIDELLDRDPRFAQLPAFVNNRVVAVDGRMMFNRPGPGLVDGLEFMVGWLNGVEHLIPADFPWKAWSGK